MFEFTLQCNKNISLLNPIYSSLKPFVQSLNGIIIKETVGCFCSVCLAVKKEHKQYMLACILDAVSDGIISFYKFDYLQNNICTVVKNSVTFNAFIRSLVVFDRQTDKDIIKKNLILDNKLNVDSFYCFKLKELTSRWQDVANVVNESIPVLLKTNSLNTLTKTFLNSATSGVKELDLYLSDKNISLSLDGKDSDLCFDASADYIEDLLTEIISICPKKIIVHGKLDKFKELKQTLCDVFSNNIYIVK